MFKKASWTNGKKELTGSWRYNWSADSFTISLDSRDRITGEYRSFIVNGDKPEWGNWKLKN
jgi:hypothetical protein